MESSYDEEKEKANICLMANYQDNEVTSQFLYHDLFGIWKKLTKETTKLEQISFVSNTISFLELRNETLEKEIKILREKQNNLVQSPSTLRQDDEADKYGECDQLKNKICDF